MNGMYDFSVERNFTKAYQDCIDEHYAVREIRCMEQMFPYLLMDIQPGDRLAGRVRISSIGFSPEPGGLGFYCNADAVKKTLDSYDYPADFQDEIQNMLKFWETRTTAYKVRKAYSDALQKALPSDDWENVPMPAAPLYRMAGAYLDFEKLLKNGIPGMRALLLERKNRAEQQGGDVVLFDCMVQALDLLAKCCEDYRQRALKCMRETTSEEEKTNLLKLSEVLGNIAHDRPKTLHEAMQLAWLYVLISGIFNYGRMDVYLGDFLENDLKNNTLTMTDAQELFNGLWQLIADRKTTWNGRVVIGGKGRRNEQAADRVALCAMEATRVIQEPEPQLTLRVYEGMNPALFDKALQVIGAGRTYPMLYNDDVNIPAVSHAFRVDLKEAEQYVPFGCGEYVLDHRSFGSPNGVINLLKVLEVTLHNGKDAITGEDIGLKTGAFEDFETFDALYDAYKRQAEYFVTALADQEALEYKITGEEAPFLYMSMLYDDCIERGKPIFSGGVHYLGGTIETYGNINTADSLTAIKEVVYDKKLLTREQLLTMLDADFKGYDEERKLLLDVAKYGNDNEQADGMAKQIHEHICNLARDQAERVHLHSYLVVIINNSANTTLGKLTAASADGRMSRMYMANANNPWSGNDKQGLTAMLNSLVKLRPDIHAGAVQNMKFSPELFKNDGLIVKGVLKSYFESGGTQAMISVVSKNDLEAALVHPEQYRNLFVRVGGFSARFVELLEDVQQEILNRTLY